MTVESFAQPLKKLAESGIDVAAQPAAGLGLALTEFGKLPPGVIDLPYTFFELNSTGYGAAPDNNYRDATNCSTKTNVGSSNWITQVTPPNFKFPSAGTYLMAMGKRLPNAEGGTVGLFMLDRTSGSFVDQMALRAAINAGGDPSANIVRSGLTAGPTIFTPNATHTYGFGGYYSGSSNFSIWFAAIRLPL